MRKAQAQGGGVGLLGPTPHSEGWLPDRALHGCQVTKLRRARAYDLRSAIQGRRSKP